MLANEASRIAKEPGYGYQQPPNYPGHQMTGIPNQNQTALQMPVQSSGQLQPVNNPLPEWSWCNLITSIVSFFLCTIIGFIAAVMSILAYVDHNNYQQERAAKKIKISYRLACVGIVVGAVIFIALICMIAK